MKLRNRLPASLLAFALLILAACGAERSPPAGGNEVVEGLRGGTLVLGERNPLRLQVQIADTPPAQARGLMGVEEMPDDYGLVFLWSSTGRHGFYMKNTLIPLDIAWWNDQMRIVDIQTMQPCEADPCPTYAPAEDHLAAVEVNGGLLAERGIRVGDPVEFTASEGGV